MPTDEDRDVPSARTMTALRWHARGDVRPEQLPVPTPAGHQALIRVRYTGLCGSDLEEFLHGPVVVDAPVVLGHEIVGVVVQAARDGSGPVVGTEVVVDVVTGCGHCYWCLRHQEGQCRDVRVTGQHTDGGLAEYVVGTAARLVPIPVGLDPLHAVLAEPTAVAVRGARRLGSSLGAGVVVFGGGTIGLLIAQVLQHRGADPVVVLEPDPQRRRVAARLDLEAVWEDEEEARRQLLAARFPGRGVDVVVECSGAPGVAREAVRTVRNGGRALLLSVTPQEEPLDTTDVVIGEKTVLGSAAHMWDDDVVPAVELLAGGAVRVIPLLAPTVPLRDAAQAFHRMAARDEGGVKLVVSCAEAEPPHPGRSRS